MAKPTVFTPANVALIESLREPGVTGAELLRRVRRAGVTISQGSLHAYLKRTEHPDSEPAGAAALRARLRAGQQQAEALAAAAAEATATDDLAALRATADAVRRALAEWAPRIAYEPAAVRAHASLSRSLADLTARLLELSPPSTPDPEHDPAHVAAKARLLARVDEELARHGV